MRFPRWANVTRNFWIGNAEIGLCHHTARSAFFCAWNRRYRVAQWSRRFISERIRHGRVSVRHQWPGTVCCALGLYFNFLGTGLHSSSETIPRAFSFASSALLSLMFLATR